MRSSRLPTYGYQYVCHNCATKVTKMPETTPWTIIFEVILAPRYLIWYQVIANAITIIMIEIA